MKNGKSDMTFPSYCNVKNSHMNGGRLLQPVIFERKNFFGMK